MSKLLDYLIRNGDALSQVGNTLIGGEANESLSGRAYRTKSVWEIVIDALFFWDKNHCKVTHENDIRYAQDFLAENDLDYINFVAWMEGRK